MVSLSDIPVDVLLDNVLPSVPVTDLLHLGSTNRFFATLVSDDLFWKRKLQEDFNFSGAGTARTSGWKFIYRGLSDPKVFVWGLDVPIPCDFDVLISRSTAKSPMAGSV
jgi:SCF-associated factor 1